MMNGIATGIQKWSSFVCLRIPHLAFRRVANSKVIPFWHYSASCPTLKICKWGQHSIGQKCCVKLRSKHLLGRCKSSWNEWMRRFFSITNNGGQNVLSTPSIHLQRRSRNRFLISSQKSRTYASLPIFFWGQVFLVFIFTAEGPLILKIWCCCAWEAPNPSLILLWRFCFKNTVVTQNPLSSKD